MSDPWEDGGTGGESDWLAENLDPDVEEDSLFEPVDEDEDEEDFDADDEQ